VFNGCAQVIVQSEKNAGTIKLTAHAKELQSATVTITSNAAALAPAVH
jgi:hypothetical protein